MILTVSDGTLHLSDSKCPSSLQLKKAQYCVQSDRCSENLEGCFSVERIKQSLEFVDTGLYLRGGLLARHPLHVLGILEYWVIRKLNGISVTWDLDQPLGTQNGQPTAARLLFSRHGAVQVSSIISHFWIPFQACNVKNPELITDMLKEKGNLSVGYLAADRCSLTAIDFEQSFSINFLLLCI